MVPRLLGPARTDETRRMVWIWFVIAGAFILLPGVAIIYFFTRGYPYPSYITGYLLVLLFGPPVALVAIGLLVIAFGLARRSLSRHQRRTSD